MSKTEKCVEKLGSAQVDTNDKVTKLFRTVEELNHSVHSTSKAKLELKSTVGRLDQRVAVVELKHQQFDRVESDTTMLKNAVNCLTSSQQEVQLLSGCFKS